MPSAAAVGGWHGRRAASLQQRAAPEALQQVPRQQLQQRRHGTSRHAAGPHSGGPGADVVAGAAASALPASRLQQEVGQLVALDVEFTHLEVPPGGRHMGLPAEVCLVDASGRTLLLEHCNPLEGGLEGRRWRHVGGMPPALWQYAASLGEVRARLAALLAGRVLVGHHVRKDLKALGLSHPAEATRDTMGYSELQGRGGAGRKLRQLSAERLGREIQRCGRRHSPREDAQAAMDLYLQEVHFQKRHMRYEDLVQHHLAQILSGSDGGGSGGGLDDASGG